MTSTLSTEDLSTEGLLRLRQSLAFLLWQAGAVRFQLEEPFLLASGNRSPVYVNCRQMISDPVFMGLYVACARWLCRQRKVTVDAVAGGETAGIPYAAYLAQALDRPMLYVRKKAKGYGIASKVEGSLEAGARVLLVEDLITDGGSKMGFVEALREAGGEVSDALVLFDRQQGGEGTLAEHGIRLHAVADRGTTLTVAQECGLLSPQQRDSLDHYFADPAVWHRERGYEFHPA
ncbi:MAG: orotate phosphoribosyltransferase [Acidobacteriota bacterium]|nr:orotate phosphoribosyltransferase [Acidobacteriota bacterium]